MPVSEVGKNRTGSVNFGKLFTMKNGVRTIPLTIHCPESPFYQYNEEYYKTTGLTPCHDLQQIRWRHDDCDGLDWIDGTGTVHCDCSQRFILDCSFRCKAHTEYEARNFYTDKVRRMAELIKTIRSTTMKDEYEDLNDSEKEHLDKWINEMINEIKEKAKSR